MHARLIALLDRKEGETSSDVRERTDSRLMREGFTGEGGLFASSPSDWFVIGGRWSGNLTEVRLDQDKLKAFWADYNDQRLGWSGFRPEEEQRAKAQELFRQFFPEFEGEQPVYRDPYQTLGYEDDAQILDETLLEFLGKLEAYPESGSIHEGKCFVDLDSSYTEPGPDSIGKKWCVVVDFHS